MRTKTEQLQSLAESLATPENYGFTVEFRPFQGWFAVPDESRWIGDTGEWIGSNYDEAVRGLRMLIG